MTVNNGKLCLPVKITQENKEKIKFNPNHQGLVFSLMAHRDESVESEENGVFRLCDWLFLYS